MLETFAYLGNFCINSPVVFHSVAVLCFLPLYYVILSRSLCFAFKVSDKQLCIC